MTEDSTYDVAIIGYGPTGATAANLLGRLGLNVVVIERDPDVYGRARAISTDEEVMRIWQSVGLADRLQRDMLPDRPLTWVDADGVPFIETKMTPRGCGHPPQQFLYQPAVDQVLREGVDRFRQCRSSARTRMPAGRQSATTCVELMLADLRTDTFKRLRASYVIAADGGSSPTRGLLGRRLHRTHLHRALGRHRHQGDPRMGRPRPAAVPLQPRAPDRRLPHAAGASPLGVPGPRRRGRERNSLPMRPCGRFCTSKASPRST